MTFKVKCFWKNKYVLFVIIALIICCTYLITRKSPSLRLEEREYELIEGQFCNDFSTDSSEKISWFINYINTNKFRKIFKRVDTLASPEIIFSLKKKDGTSEKMEIYSGAWEEGLFLLYKDNQYQIKKPDKFCESIENVFLR